MPLTSRERLTRLFNKQDIDRVPIWLLNPVDGHGSYADIYNLPCYKRLIPYIRDVCDNFNRRGYARGFCYNGNPDIKNINIEITVEGERFTVPATAYGDKVWARYTVRTGKGTRVKFMLNEPEELRDILDIPYVQPVIDASKYEEERAALGERGLMMADIGDALGPLYSLMGPEDFALATATHYSELLEFLDVMCERNLTLYKALLEKNICDVFFVVGAEFAIPPLVSPDKFHDLSSRYVKQVIDLIRSYGKHSIVHCHGHIYEILDGMAYIDPDGLHTIEAPPVGNCTLTQAREALKDTVLIGNIQYDDIYRFSRDEMYEAAKQTVLEGRTGRFILSPTAGPYASDIPEGMTDNYIAIIEAGLEYGKF